jgi:hypothetical protein
MKATSAVYVDTDFGVNPSATPFACSIYVNGVGLAVSGDNVSNAMKVEALIKGLMGIGAIESVLYTNYSEELQIVTLDSVPVTVKIVVKLISSVGGAGTPLGYPSTRAFTFNSENIGSLSGTNLFNRLGAIVVEQTGCTFQPISVIIDVGNEENT